MLCAGANLGTLRLENVRFLDLGRSSYPKASKRAPLTISLKNVSYQFREDSEDSELFSLNADSFVRIVEE